jgi:hypothetical protein
MKNQPKKYKTVSRADILFTLGGEALGFVLPGSIYNVMKYVYPVAASLSQ